MQDNAPRRELVRYYRWLRTYGYNDSHSGNASVRVGEHYWITPTGSGADTLTAEQLLCCHTDGYLPPGASGDSRLHLAIYQQNTHHRAVLHAHSPHCIALTLHTDAFRPIDFEGQLYFSSVPVLDIPADDYWTQSPTAVAHALQQHRAVIVRGHGVYCAAENLDLAYKWICSLELSAKIAYLSNITAESTPSKHQRSIIANEPSSPPDPGGE